MKSLIATALLVTSFTSFAEVKIETFQEQKVFTQHFVSSNKAGKVTVKVDYAKVQVDCHGLDAIYSKNSLSSGEILVMKQPLMHTMEMCGPAPLKTVNSGIKFTVEFKESYGGTKVILAPADSLVTAE